MSAGAHRGSLHAPGAPNPLGHGLPTAEWASRFGFAAAEFHARIPSTNDRARELVRAGRPLPALVVASRQSAGKGRMGRSWTSDSSLGLWFTVALARGHEPRDPLALRAGLAAALAVESMVPELAVRVKWPNDLVAGPDGRKFCGILCERTAGAAIVGVGLNLNHGAADFPATLSGRATSVRIETGRSLAPADALQAVLAKLDTCRRPADRLGPRELEQLNARSFLAGKHAVATGVALAPSGEKRTMKALPVSCGPILADGALEVRGAAVGTLRLVAGSVVP